jgi:phosphatidylglycerophosphate synthase
MSGQESARKLPVGLGYAPGMGGHSLERGSDERDLLGLAADGLTLGRMVVAVALIPVLGVRRVALGAALLGCAWLSDYFDGRAARASTGRTRLGDFDLWADTFVGAGAVLGFTVWGWVPPVVGLGLAAFLLTAFALTKNEAMSMLLQATGYGLVLWRTWRDGHTVSLWWLLTIIAVIAVVNRRIFWERSLPTFLRGMATVVRRRATD